MEKLTMLANKKGRSLSIVALCGLFTLSAGAQLKENVEVEGRYVPEIIRADRINTFPSLFTPQFQTSALTYEENGVPASFLPTVMTMPATGWRASRVIDAKKGYLDIAAGSWLNSSLSAGYRFVDNATTVAGVRLQHNSTSLWKPKLSAPTADVKRERYDENIGIYAAHIFKGIGRLDASLDYHVGYFNYYDYAPVELPASLESVDAPTQTLNDVRFKIGWRSPLTSTPSLSYYGTVTFNHFAYRALYMPGADGLLLHGKGMRESQLSVDAGIGAPWGDGSSAGLNVKADALMYGEREQTVMGRTLFPGISNYGMVSLNPYYDFTRGLLQIHIGADIDLAVNAGPKGSRYSFFHIAPDVKFAMRSGSFGMYLNLLGGSELQTLANLWQLDYYQMPRLATTRPVYCPLDGRFGINLGPFSGVSADFSVAWKSTERVPLRGWYTPMLNYGTQQMPGIDEATGRPAYSLDADGLSIHGFSLCGRLAYDPGKYVKLHGEVSYQPQDGKKGYFNGYDRPRWIAGVGADITPIEPLDINIAYEYRGVRRAYCHSYATLPTTPGAVVDGALDRPILGSMRLPDLTLLSIGGRWKFTRDFSVSLRGDNLLNRHDALLPGLPAEGVCIIGGLEWLF